MGRGLGACKGKNPEEKGVSTLLMGTFCTVWGPFGIQSHTSPTATALCSGAVALFHAVPAMDTDPYAGHGRNWWIRGFFFPQVLAALVTWSGRNGHLQQTPRRKAFPGNTVLIRAMQSHRCFLREDKHKDVPGAAEPESTDKA